MASMNLQDPANSPAVSGAKQSDSISPTASGAKSPGRVSPDSGVSGEMGSQSPAILSESAANASPPTLEVESAPDTSVGPLKPDDSRLEPRTPVRNRPVSSGMSPKSPAPEAGVTQIARDIESQLEKLEETLATYETDLTKRLDQIVNRLKD